MIKNQFKQYFYLNFKININKLKFKKNMLLKKFVLLRSRCDPKCEYINHKSIFDLIEKMLSSMADRTLFSGK